MAVALLDNEHLLCHVYERQYILSARRSLAAVSGKAPNLRILRVRGMTSLNQRSSIAYIRHDSATRATNFEHAITSEVVLLFAVAPLETSSTPTE